MCRLEVCGPALFMCSFVKVSNVCAVDLLDGNGDRSASLQDGLVTLSGLPKSRWHNLHILDIIKVRTHS